MTASVDQTERIAGVWKFDRIHSAVTFKVDYLAAPFRLQFSDFDADLANGQLTGSAGARSTNVADDLLESHLVGPEFFGASEFPRASFTSTEVRIEGDEITVEGELTLRGTTKLVRGEGRIAGPLEDFMGKRRIGISLSASIDRTEFGLQWNAPLPAGGMALADQVEIDVDLEFIAVDPG